MPNNKNLSDTNTGEGGFEIDGQTHTYDVGTTVPPHPRNKQFSSDAGFYNDDGSPKDISAPTKVTLGQYLSDLSKGKIGPAPGMANSYAIDPNPHPASIAPIGGVVLPPTPSTNSQQFDAKYSESSSRSDALNAIGKYPIKVGAGPGVGPNGHHALHDITTYEGNEPKSSQLYQRNPTKSGGVRPNTSGKLYESYSGNVLSQNRWSSSVTRSQSLEYTYAVPPESETARLNKQETVSANKMGALGHELMLLATERTGEPDVINPRSRPTSLMLGLKAKVPYDTLSTQRAIETLEAEASTEMIGGITDESWGVYYNYVNRFGSNDLTTILVFGVTLAATLVGVTIISALAGAISSTSAAAIRPRPNGENGVIPVKGRYNVYNDDASIIDAVNISAGINFYVPVYRISANSTAANYIECVISGLAAHLGWSDEPKNPIAFTVTTLSKLLQYTLSPSSRLGVDVGLFRNILRSTLYSYSTFGAEFSRVLRYNPLSCVSFIIDFINSLKIWKFANILAKIGDVRSALNNERGKDPASIDPKKLIRSAIQNGRQVAGASDLAWQGRLALGTNLIVPTYLKQAASMGKAASGYHDGGKLNDRKDGMFAYSDIEKIERALDAEYVPFYFHDLRTNEIISFHAFLTSLDDSYTPEYGSESYIGRTESVNTYKGTNRKISFSFYVVSTNSADYAEMYRKINKLTTLAYPQYSSGKLVTSGKGDTLKKFYMPFSQLVTSPPMIRLRVGDVIRSNYSRFALADMFGLSSGMTIDGVQYPAEGSPPGQEKMTTRILIRDFSRCVILLDAKDYVYSQGFLPSVHPEDIPFINESSYTPQGNYFLIQGDKMPSKILDSIEIPASVDKKKLSLNTTKFVIPKTDAEVEKLPAALASFGEKLGAFMEPNNNSIVRYFEQGSPGKGLAGFLGSLKFDWGEKDIPWETQHTILGQAPKMCKVTSDLKVVHDISPGINAVGYNRAPIYPVGLMSTYKAGK